MKFLESGPKISARFCSKFWECLWNAEENVLEALVGLLAGFWQVLEQVWRALMSFQEGYWELLENELGASLSLQLTVGA